MAERLADVVRQIHNVQQLGAVVNAMRGIAASRAQRARSLLVGVDAYTHIISRAIGQALTLPLPNVSVSNGRRTKFGLILFCAEQGFAGAFSERVLETVAAELDGATALIIGSRGNLIAKERGIIPVWSAPMANHVETVPDFANRLVDALYGYVASGGMTKVDIVYSRAISGGIQIERHSLLPIDFRTIPRATARLAPLTTLRPELLLRRLAAEYVYAQLCQAAMHAFEAENEARMMAMTGAKTNVAKKLSALRQRERQLRQEEITTEIVELAAGTEALQGKLK